MKKHNRDVQIIEETLIQAHRSTSQAEPGPFFHKKVMTRILEESGSSRALAPNGLNTGRLVWRLALLSYLVVTVLAAHLMTSGLDSQYQVSWFILDNSSSLDLFHTFGIM
ncbi:MAG: hypothetical protein NTU74_13140 [Deltaproteobacteria bacterium]|nr:hypothetical protein [Deltaproteobacteria bacterium]